MSISSLDSFLENHAEIQPLVVKTEGKESKWGRLVCHWHEKKDDKEIDHIFTPLINLENSDIYLDCSKKKIYAKFLAHTFLRPIHVAFKTIYHLAIPISIPHIVCETISAGKEQQLNAKEIAKNCVKNSVNSLIDIIRTPLIGVAMTIVNVAALIIGPLAPKTLYTFREWTGHLIHSLHRKNDLVLNDIFSCFQPLDNLQKIDRRDREYDDTNYITAKQDSSKNYLIGLSNFARNNIINRREHYAFFNNPCGKLDPSVRFISPSYDDVKKSNSSL
jgi:hypothetical protein